MGVTALDYDIEILNGLAFEIALPCETRFHEEFGFTDKAEWVIDVTCTCGNVKRYLVCQPCLNTLLDAMLGCGECGVKEMGRECIRVVMHV